MGIGNRMGLKLYSIWLLVVWSVLLWTAPASAGEVDMSATFKVAKHIDMNPVQEKKAGASLVINEKYEYYDINGTSVAELRNMMKQKGTKWNDGKIYAALTTWDLRPRYGIKSDNGKYSIQSVKTDVAIVYHLPSWTAVTTAPEQMAIQWNTYVDHLKKHESGHKDLAVKAAAEINETLASFSSYNSRSELDKEVSRLVKASLKRLRELQDDYDIETRHGETQGVALP